MQPGSGLVIGGIKAGTFKDHTHRPDHLAQAVLVAFRAALERRVSE